jgi:hypothetical protein
LLLFIFIRLSGGYYTEHVGFRLGKTDKQQALSGKTGKQETILFKGAVPIIVVFFPQGVEKSGERVGKVKLVFLDIVPILFFIPNKFHITLLLYTIM